MKLRSYCGFGRSEVRSQQHGVHQRGRLGIAPNKGSR